MGFLTAALTAAALGGTAMAVKKSQESKNANAERNSAMARGQSIQDALDKQTKSLNSSLDSVDPVKTNDRVLTADPTKKNTIKSLNIPLNTGSSGTGLNV